MAKQRKKNWVSLWHRKIPKQKPRETTRQRPCYSPKRAITLSGDQMATKIGCIEDAHPETEVSHSMKHKLKEGWRHDASKIDLSNVRPRGVAPLKFRFLDSTATLSRIDRGFMWRWRNDINKRVRKSRRKWIRDANASQTGERRANSPLLLYPSMETNRQVTAERHLNTYFGQANMVQSDVHGSGSDKAMREGMDREWRKLAEDEASC